MQQLLKILSKKLDISTQYKKKGLDLVKESAYYNEHREIYCNHWHHNC
jgi:hypothetical protein